MAESGIFLPIQPGVGYGARLAIEASQPCHHGAAQRCNDAKFMGKRREARERAVQFLFQYDLNPPEDLDRALSQFWESQRAVVIAADQGPARWGGQVEVPPPSAEEASVRLFAEP